MKNCVLLIKRWLLTDPRFIREAFNGNQPSRDIIGKKCEVEDDNTAADILLEKVFTCPATQTQKDTANHCFSILPEDLTP